MKPINITIQPPITEHCSVCDYEDSVSLRSYKPKCPKCGNDIRQGSRKLNPSFRCQSIKGNYNICNANEYQYQYLFFNAPNGKQYSFVINEDIDTSDPIDVIAEIVEIYKKYLYTSKLKQAKELLELVNNEDFRGKNERRKAEEKKEKLEREIFELNYFYHFYD